MGVRCIGKDTSVFAFSKTLAPLEIIEASGIVSSYKHSGHFWIHDDGGRGIIYLLNPAGNAIGSIAIKSMFGISDLEDIALFVDPITSKSYIYVGDIGDNNAVRDIKTIFVFEEPEIHQLNPQTNAGVVPQLNIRFRYPDGKRDAESVMVDPRNGDVFIVSKREANVNVYVAKTPLSDTTVITLTKLGSVPYRFITGADISADGSEILLRDYEKAYYWQRLPNETIAQTLSKNAQCLAIIAEEQGEGICFARDGSSFHTISERVRRPEEYIYTYTRK